MAASALDSSLPGVLLFCLNNNRIIPTRSELIPFARAATERAFRILDDGDPSDAVLPLIDCATLLKRTDVTAGDRLMAAVIAATEGSLSPFVQSIIQDYISGEDVTDLPSDGETDLAWWSGFARENPDLVSQAGVLEALGN